jgi:D-amino-acid dehydrogenase
MTLRVAVVGAGIVGLSTAIYLRRAEVEVTLYDRAAPGRETSIWNAGVLATSSLIPLANPGIFRRLPRLLLNRTPGVRVDWRAARSVLPWGLRFLAASRKAHSERSVAALHALISRSRLCHADLLGQAGAADLLREEGWLFLYRSPDAFAASAAARPVYERYGIRHEILSADALRDFEPGLTGRFAGAVQFPGSAFVTDPRHAMDAYARLLRGLGARTQESDVRRVEPVDEGRWRVQTNRGAEGPFDHVVLAAGAWTNWLLQPFGSLPLIVERGYLRRYALAGAAALRRPVYDVENGYVLSPRPEGVQLSSGTEITTLDRPPRPEMFFDAERRARSALPLGAPLDPEPAVGNRPSLPDGLPAIGPLAGRPGLWVAAGHQHVGFSTGPASGELIRDLILSRTPMIHAKPFSAARFGSRG